MCMHFLRVAKIFSSGSPLRGTQGARVHTTRKAQFWAPAGLRGGCSGRPKPRELALSEGITFHDAEPRRTKGSPIFQLFALLLLSHRPLSRSLRCGGHDTAAVAHRALHPVAATDSSASACECVACFLSSYTSIANTWEET